MKKHACTTPLLLRLASRTSMCLRGAAASPVVAAAPDDVEHASGRTVPPEGTAGDGGAADTSSTYYPVYLPMDQDFKAKYMWHHRNLSRRGKTVKERCYLFLEHPTGWLCFIYHMSV